MPSHAPSPRDDALPRVTYANASADFSSVHALFDREFPAFAARRLGRAHPNAVGGRDDDGGRRYDVPSPLD
ncbi:MAG TPA: hypothetical protein VM491_19950, partial [Burkholderiaceae bacterium]|nr:hypothetical protein [Burkholderiaceae bacterium]